MNFIYIRLLYYIIKYQIYQISKILSLTRKGKKKKEKNFFYSCLFTIKEIY